MPELLSRRPASPATPTPAPCFDGQLGKRAISHRRGLGLTILVGVTGVALLYHQGSGTLGESLRPPAAQHAAWAKGSARNYTDNSNGTITDDRTGLVWEKLSIGSSIHDATQLYTWDDAFSKIAALNGSEFAGYTDWRLPSVSELQTLIDYGRANPAIASAFNAGCTSDGCVASPCSCTKPFHYWSSTTCQASAGDAWLVSFDAGYVVTDTKRNSYYVRAVRGSS